MKFHQFTPNGRYEYYHFLFPLTQKSLESAEVSESGKGGRTVCSPLFKFPGCSGRYVDAEPCKLALSTRHIGQAGGPRGCPFMRSCALSSSRKPSRLSTTLPNKRIHLADCGSLAGTRDQGSSQTHK